MEDWVCLGVTGSLHEGLLFSSNFGVRCRIHTLFKVDGTLHLGDFTSRGYRSLNLSQYVIPFQEKL